MLWQWTEVKQALLATVRLFIMINTISNEYLDSIFLFYMKSFLRKRKYGVDGLKVDIKGIDESVFTIINLGIELIKQGSLPFELDFVLECEILSFLNQVSEKKILVFQMTLVRRLSVFLQKEDICSLFEYENLFGTETREYLCMTFIPNLSKEIQEKLELKSLIENIPKEKFQLNDY